MTKQPKYLRNMVPQVKEKYGERSEVQEVARIDDASCDR